MVNRLNDLVGDLERRAKDANDLSSSWAPGEPGYIRCRGKASAYEHAASMLRADIANLALVAETPKPAELWLVHDRGRRDGKSVVEQYRLFDDRATAMTHAQSVGFSDWPGMGINPKIGIANVYQCGDVHVIVTRLR